MYNILLVLLGYFITVFGMYVHDFRQSLEDADKIIHIRSILLESAVIYLAYYLIVKDNLIDKEVQVWFLKFMVTEKTSLGINLLSGILGYDKIYKHIFKKRKIQIISVDPDENED